jgi:hypothetical protein
MWFQVEKQCSTISSKEQERDMPHEWKFAFSHFNMGSTPEAVAIPGHTHNGTDGQHNYFEKKKKLFQKRPKNIFPKFSNCLKIYFNQRTSILEKLLVIRKVKEFVKWLECNQERRSEIGWQKVVATGQQIIAQKNDQIKTRWWRKKLRGSTTIQKESFAKLIM